MSRRSVSADEPGWTWEYGWDPARGTFYARLLAGEGAARRELAHFGSRVGEIRTSDSLMYLMGVRLPADRIAVLEHDRLTDSEEVEALASAWPDARQGSRGRPDERTARPGARRLAVATERAR
ncbi:MAG TPA: hypothetical protein VMU20_17930 [Candidatus Dormibacteraeota bacterium]|nr:hypothetical protein [Candidatus Dormibacteraeota bacterium]